MHYKQYQLFITLFTALTSVHISSMHTPQSALVPYAVAVYIADYKYKNKQLIHAIITHPSSVLEDAKQVENDFLTHLERKTKTTTLSLNQVPLLIKEYENRHPFFTLKECDHKDCSLNRCNNPFLRSTFESRAKALLLEQIHANPHRFVQYVSFGSGHMFVDIIILVKALLCKPKAMIHIHAIDNLYKKHIDCLDKLGIPHEINCSDALIDNKEACFFSQIPFKQCLQWLTKTFPSAKFALSIHSSYKRYWRYQHYFQKPLPDLIVAADINMAENDNKISSSDIFLSFALAVLQIKPSCSNLLLDHTSRNARLSHVSFHEKTASQKKEYTSCTMVPFKSRQAVYIYDEVIPQDIT